MTDHSHYLRQANLRATPARIAVLEILSAIDTPVDVAFIVDKINLSFDQATVYRTVDTLVKEGLIKQVDFREGKYRYELEGDHHHHLVCQKCGSITPIYEQCVAITDSTIATKYNFTVTDHHLEFFGHCHKCNA